MTIIYNLVQVVDYTRPDDFLLIRESDVEDYEAKRKAYLGETSETEETKETTSTRGRKKKTDSVDPVEAVETVTGDSATDGSTDS